MSIKDVQNKYRYLTAFKAISYNGGASNITTIEISKSWLDLENPMVQQILEIAEELIHGNTIFDAKLLCYEARKRLKLNRKLVLKIVQALLEKKILIEGAKFTKELVLLNPHRKNIYEFIVAHPGANFSKIKNTYEGTTKSSGQLIWHLQTLMKFNHIKKVKYKKYTLFLPMEIAEAFGIHAFLLSDELNREIIKLLIEEVRIKKADIYKYLRKPREKIHYRLTNLLEADLLEYSEDTQEAICVNAGCLESLIELIQNFEFEGGLKEE